eukprot:TRINITY_DN647_c5_g1_i3.p1 TRINITY_DN647_c5_g1~~TRINITY_DN647_c5_g1_i3.p1  ORF type:complete len:746 (+),score=145.56 TRINITY_DN647_c5_g1_i3:94-2331(+)
MVEVSSRPMPVLRDRPISAGVRPTSADRGPRPPSEASRTGRFRPASAASSTGTARKRKAQTPQFLCNAHDEVAVLPRPLPPGMAYVANYTSFDDLVDKQILTQDDDEVVHLSVAEVAELYRAKCADQGLQPNRKREGRFIQLLSQNCKGMLFALRENGLGAKSAECLTSILSDNEHFALLDLSGNRLKDIGAARIAELLLVNDTLVHIALKSNDIGFLGAEKIAEALQTNNTVTSLDLSGLSGINRNHMGLHGAKAMGETLAVNETLASLNLGANGLGDEGIALLAQGLERNTTLTDLNLGSNNIGWTGCAVLGPLLNNCNLQALNLERNDIRDKGVTILAQSLKSPNIAAEQVRVLNLSYNNLKSQGFRWLSTIFRSARALVELRLDGNDCGEALGDFVSAIKDNKSIRHLTLSKCELTELHGSYIGDTLQSQSSIKKLELQDNTLGDQGAISIAKALEGNRCLQHLDLGSNKIKDAGGNAIGAMLHQNNTLQHLNIRQNNLKASGDSIAEALKTNQTLLELDFSYNDFSFKSYSAVGSHLQKNLKHWRRQAVPRLLSQIDVLKVDEATLHGTQEEIVQEIKRREITEDNLSQKKEHTKQVIAVYYRNVKKLEEEFAQASQHRIREEDAMGARSEELLREKQKQESSKRKIENKVKSEEEKISRMRRDQARIENEIKAFNEKTEEELAPRRRDLAALVIKQQRAEQAAKEQAEALSKTEVCSVSSDLQKKKKSPRVGGGVNHQL